MPARNYIELIEKSMRVLELLSKEEDGYGLKQIASKAGLVKSSAFRILYTFRELGYVERAAESGNYALGLKVLSLARSSLSQATLNGVARPYMEALRDELGESVLLAELRGDVPLLIDIIEGSHPLRVFLEVGSECPIHASSLGKVIAAHLDEARLARAMSRNPLVKFTPHTRTDVAEIMAHFEEIRRQGYAINLEETIEGSVLVAAPVFDGCGKVFAGVTVSIPTARWKTGDSRPIIDGVKNCGEAITQALVRLKFCSG